MEKAARDGQVLGSRGPFLHAQGNASCNWSQEEIFLHTKLPGVLEGPLAQHTAWVTGGREWKIVVNFLCCEGY